MTFFLQIILAWVFLSCAYWFAVRDVLKDAIQFRLFAQRDKLRMLAFAKGMRPSSAHYHHLEERLCATIDSIDDISVPRYVRFLAGRNKKNTSYQTQHFDKASPELRQIWNDSVKYVVLGMLINSPAFLAIAASFFVSLHFVRFIGAMRTRVLRTYTGLVRATDNFVDTVLVPAFTRAQELPA